jgi:regulation of enolase protein 1 (concanavalin A-like superfamily)
VSGFVYTNNLSRHNTYGIDGQKTATGTATLDRFFPGWVFKGNVLAGGNASVYPAGNYFPTVAAFQASFVNFTADNYALAAGSPFIGAGTDGLNIGAPIAAVSGAQTLAETGDSTGWTGGGSGGGGGTTGGGSDSTAGTLPTGWLSQDVGAVGMAGSSSETGGVFSVQGAGDDIWDTADAFHFVYRTLTGDGTIVARVSAVSGSQAWTKVGVMMRGGLAPDAAHALMLVSARKGIAFQRRATAGGASVSTTPVPGVAPRWVRLQRAGSTLTASFSADGTSWTVAGSATVALPTDALVGLAVSSHTSTELAAGTFDHVAVTSGQALPAGWQSTDIGAVGVAGVASASGGTFTVKGSGDDVWGTADAAQFAWRTLEGDGQIVARVAAVSGSQAWTKAGVMMRMTLDPGSPQAFMLVSVGKGVAFQRRTVSGGLSTSTSGGAGTAPKWVKLSRTGSVITASVSNDGSRWTIVGSDTFSIAGPLHVGLAVSSHDSSVLATATFDNVQ